MRGALLFSTLVVLLGGCVSSAPVGSSGPIPAAWPRTLAIGLRSDLGRGDWLRASGAPFAFRYQYLSGGPRSGDGLDWTTWRQPPGRVIDDYLRESDALGVAPMFVYYYLLQLTPDNGRDERTHVLANLADPAVTRRYFANWTLAMDRVGAARRPIFVILEPDLWGYLQQSVVATTNDPASVPAAVAQSGNPELSDLPNTAVGFAQALVRLRDRRAPNARLLLHVSPFATGVDPTQDTWPGRDDPANAIRVADHTVAFLQRLAPLTTWDALSLDIANASAAYYEARGDPTRWWDRSARVRPNFPYFLTYLRALTERSGRRIVLWQIPLGNQVYRTMNNTPGHYQDNKAEILWANLPALAEAGVIGVLFGDALPGDTTYWDQQRDGVTNPAPISARGCDRCNTRQATVPDDDGGYLREQAIQYARQPIRLRERRAWRRALADRHHPLN